MEWTEEPSNNQTQATMTIAATESPKLHPTLVKLGYPGWGCTVSALSILDCLLKDGAVKENDVERTCQRLANPISGNNEKATQDSVQKPSSSLVVLSTEQSTKPQQHNNNKDTTMKQDKKKKKKTTTTVKKKQKQKSDPIPRQTRHVALRFYYDGGKYSGLAQNVGSATDHSVERAIFAALIKTHLIESRESCGYSRCGRTDRGVSAAGQVIALRVRSSFPVLSSTNANGRILLQEGDLPNNSNEVVDVYVPGKNKMQDDDDDNNSPQWTKRQVSEYAFDKMLNNVLPPDIRILGWSPVSENFSARFSATTRLYRYFFIRGNMDLVRMKEALDRIKGIHDFRNFCKMDVEKVYNFERKIHKATLVEYNNNDKSATRTTVTTANSHGLCHVEILGQAFLWHQIRCIVSVLFMVGKGLEEPSVVSELLDVQTNPGKPSYDLAPERPLVLHDCGYPNLRFGHNCQNLWTVHCHLQEQWEELILSAARIRNCIDTLRTDVSVQQEDVYKFILYKQNERAKKQRKRKATSNSGTVSLLTIPPPFSMKKSRNGNDGQLLLWKDAVEWFAKMNMIPGADGARENVHVPLMERSRGTTYEEKIAALTNSQKRFERYEENVVKKRKTKEEDQAFYQHMTSQGGSGV